MAISVGAKDVSVDEERSADTSASGSPAALFTTLWDALADVLGTAATAMLVKRAAARAARRCPELGALSIWLKKLDYGYDLPPSWNDHKGELPLALRELAGELRPLLVDLTGEVVLNHLARVPELREHGLVVAQEETS